MKAKRLRKNPAFTAPGKRLITAILSLCLFVALGAQDKPFEWTGIERIVAIGDIHGDYNNFITIMRGTGLVDKNNNWTGEKTHLVQLGDIMDKGPDARKVFDLLKKLQKQAEQKGGKIHILLGNHEELNILGIAFDYQGYVSVAQFVSFLPERMRLRLEKIYLRKKRLTKPEGDNKFLPLTKDVWEYWDRIRSRESVQRRYTDFFNENYGDWLLNQGAVIKINKIIFVHAGISKTFSTWSLKDINSLIVDELLYLRRLRKERSNDPCFTPRMVFHPQGILWYRDLAQKDEEDIKDDVDTILKNLEATHMVIGHTPLKKDKLVLSDISRFEDKIFTIDTGISDAYGGYVYALIYERGKFSLWGN
jgi:hypothetical protein